MIDRTLTEATRVEVIVGKQPTRLVIRIDDVERGICVRQD